MNEIIMMPAQRQRLNLGEFAEEAVIVEDIIRTPSHLHFIEANTQEVTINHLMNDCITPVFSKGQRTDYQSCPIHWYNPRRSQ